MNRWHLKGEPKSVQVRAFELARNREGYGLWMEQGLAKTTTVLNLFLDAHLRDELDTLFVIAKKPLRYNWVDQAQEWGFNIPFTVYDTAGWIGPMPAPGKPRVLVGYYENSHLNRAIGDYKAAIRNSGKVKIVWDESQMVKGYNSKYTKAAFDMNMFAEKRLLLSGTPQSQSPMDWWSQLRLIKAIKGVSPVQFRLRYCKMGGYMGKQIKGANEENLPELQRIIAENGFVASKKDWAPELPEKDWQTINLEMPDELIKHYRTMEQDFYAELGDDDLITANMVISSLLKLQQISSGFILRENGEAINLIDPKSAPKLIFLKDMVDGSESKMIIFTHFQHSTKLIKEVLADHSPCVIEGGMKDDDLQKEVRKFNNSKCKVMIAQASVGSTGHTMLGNSEMGCYTTIFYENSFSLITRMQAEDRNHRFGQRNAVTYFDFVSSKVEKKVIEALQKKKDLVETVVGMIREKPNAD